MSTSLLLDTLYTAALAALSPYYAYRLATDADYRAGFAERRGHIPARTTGERMLWLHCSSVGETLLARRLVPEIEHSLAGWRVGLSSSTETGYNTAFANFAGHPVFRHPLDLSWVVRRTLRAVRPSALALMEREIWPQLVLAAASEGVPVALVNARRFSDRSAWWYRRLGKVAARVFDAISLYLVQEPRHAEFFAGLGVPASRIRVVGNLKFDNVVIGLDAAVARSLRERIGWPAEAPVWVAGSTHEGEEEGLIAAWQVLRGQLPALRLVIAPRYPARAGRVHQLLIAAGIESVRWSSIRDAGAAEAEFPALVVDTLGELAAFYGIATIAFVGGSLIPHGGHNVIEPAALGCPVLIGPHHENTAEAVAFLATAGGLRVVSGADELSAAAREFLTGDATAVGRAAQEAIRQRQGSCGRHVRILTQWLTTGLSSEGEKIG